jgi:hypothetical protein
MVLHYCYIVEYMNPPYDISIASTNANNSPTHADFTQIDDGKMDKSLPTVCYRLKWGTKRSARQCSSDGISGGRQSTPSSHTHSRSTSYVYTVIQHLLLSTVATGHKDETPT